MLTYLAQYALFGSLIFAALTMIDLAVGAKPSTIMNTFVSVMSAVLLVLLMAYSV